jgi:hypothetical protein
MVDFPPIEVSGQIRPLQANSEQAIEDLRELKNKLERTLTTDSFLFL